VTGIVALLEIDLPGHMVRLCDGGFFEFGGDTFTDSDSLLGTLVSVEPLQEGVEQEIPALDLYFNPPANVSIAVLSQAAIERRSVRLWLAEYDSETGVIDTGATELRFVGIVDQPSVKFSRTEYVVSITVVPHAEYVFNRNIGNGLSASFHKSLYPGETGHDNATGLGVAIAWGTERPATTSGAASSPSSPKPSKKNKSGAQA